MVGGLRAGKGRTVAVSGKAGLKQGARKATRRALTWGAQQLPVRRRLDRLVVQLTQLLDETSADGLYGGAYFGEGRNPLDRAGISGYSSYDRVSSMANKAAFIVWSVFGECRSLDVGCALGFTVEALTEVGFDAHGMDHSEWAVRHGTRGARGRLKQASLLEPLPYADAEFGLVTALETLEHLPPESIGPVLGELRRICGGHLYATIPSFGPNRCGLDGWFSGKVRPDRLSYYESLPADYDGPIPFEDLMRDAQGQPIEGHLTMASFNWWERQFAAVGFERCCEVEARIAPALERVGQTGWWCPYVFKVPGTPELPDALRSPEEADRLAQRWLIDSP
jgi:2-polyprenyl-3-methyl-5-hydroxy-6-metoxy-1,4-benzoquinol methylase